MTTARRRTHRRLTAARVGYYLLLGVTAVTDAIPPRFRFGHWQRVLGLLGTGPGLPALKTPAVFSDADDSPPRSEHVTRPELRCMIVSGELDSGGIETVVSVLARGLPARGVAVEVACSSTGRMARELHARGVRVVEIASEELAKHIARQNPDVIQFHRVESGLMRAVAGGVPTVPVFHAMESYLDRRTWAMLDAMMARSPTAIAVSESVRAFFLERLSGSPDVRVVPNCAPRSLTAPTPDRDEARRRLSQAIGAQIGAGSRVIVSLSRFSDQKNVPGLVDAFLLAAESAPRLRLVVAGGLDSWLEVRKTQLLRAGHPSGDRVHLMDTSDASMLLAAADVFALDSFAEGGPIAAVEAAASGLPVVLSAVGFARELTNAVEVAGHLVPRANVDMSQRCLAAQRRRRHQSNRLAFARALIEAGQLGISGAGSLPEAFTEDSMVSAHARILKEAAADRRQK